MLLASFSAGFAADATTEENDAVDLRPAAAVAAACRSLTACRKHELVILLLWSSPLVAASHDCICCSGGGPYTEGQMPAIRS